MGKLSRSSSRAYVLAGVLTLVWWGFWTGLVASGRGAAFSSSSSQLEILLAPILVSAALLLARRARRLLSARELPDYAPDLSLIDALNRAANLGEGRDRLLVRLAEGTRAAFSSLGANVYVLDDTQEHLTLLSDPAQLLNTMGVADPGEITKPRITLSESRLYATALRAAQPIVTSGLDDIIAMASEFEGSEAHRAMLPSMLQTRGIASVMTVPILSAGKVSGLVDISRGWPFTPQEAERFRVICEQVALVLSRIDTEERLLKSEGLYRALTELTPDLIFVVDGDHRVVLANSATAAFIGRPLTQLRGTRIGELFASMGVRFEDRLSQVVSTGASVDSEDHLTGTHSETWLRTSLVSLGDVAPGLALGVSRDISDSKHLEDALRKSAEEEAHLATHDALTGLANRRAFMVDLGKAVALAQRGTPSTVLFMDVDCFKRCNDERGHAFGDEVLATVAELLKAEVREVDVVARLGGDEYAALLAGTSETGAGLVAQRMKASIQAYGARIGIPVDLSIGVSSIGPGADAVRVIELADQRMYEQKAAHHEHEPAPEKTWPFRGTSTPSG